MNAIKPQHSEQRVVYQNPYSKVLNQTVDFGTFTKEYFVTDYGKRSGLVIIREDSILLVRQYRLLVDGLSWEIPGGKVDDSETPEESAVRETFEETGFRCRNLKPLLSYQQTLEALKAAVHLFYTSDFEDTESFKPNYKEVEAMEWVSFPRALAMIEEGAISDSFTILALFAYKIYVSNGQEWK